MADEVSLNTRGPLATPGFSMGRDENSSLKALVNRLIVHNGV